MLAASKLRLKMNKNKRKRHPKRRRIITEHKQLKRELEVELGNYIPFLW